MSRFKADRKHSHDELLKLLHDAATDAPVSSYWRHHEGDVYVVRGFSIRKGDGVVMINYSPIVYVALTFTQPAEEFHGYAGDTKRMTQVKRTEVWQEV